MVDPYGKAVSNANQRNKRYLCRFAELVTEHESSDHNTTTLGR